MSFQTNGFVIYVFFEQVNPQYIPEKYFDYIEKLRFL